MCADRVPLAQASHHPDICSREDVKFRFCTQASCRLSEQPKSIHLFGFFSLNYFWSAMLRLGLLRMACCPSAPSILSAAKANARACSSQLLLLLVEQLSGQGIMFAGGLWALAENTGIHFSHFNLMRGGPDIAVDCVLWGFCFKLYRFSTCTRFIKRTVYTGGLIRQQCQVNRLGLGLLSREVY